MLADVADVSKLLHRFAPAALDALRVRHPDDVAYFNPSGLPLGAPVKIEPAVDAAVVMLGTVDSIASAAMTDSLAKLKSARRLELGGSLLALVSSGGVVGATLGFNDTIVAAALGVVAFLAGAVPLIAGWLRGTAIGPESISQHFIKLRELTWNARSLQAEFSRNPLRSETPNLVKRANELAREIYIILSDLGYEPRFRPV